jgi:hypothetical protein
MPRQTMLLSAQAKVPWLEQTAAVVFAQATAAPLLEQAVPVSFALATAPLSEGSTQIWHLRGFVVSTPAPLSAQTTELRSALTSTQLSKGIQDLLSAQLPRHQISYLLRHGQCFC